MELELKIALSLYYPTANASLCEVQDKCDEDKTHEVNSEMRVSDIFEEGIGKLCYAHALLTHYC